MNVVELKNLLKITLKIVKTTGAPVITEEDLELETKQVTITLPKTCWDLLQDFEIKELGRSNASTKHLFEEAIIVRFLSSPQIFMTLLIKQEEKNELR